MGTDSPASCRNRSPHFPIYLPNPRNHLPLTSPGSALRRCYRVCSLLMPSLKQLEANRRNAQKSTGPRSVEGKAASSQNALKSGIDAKAQTLPGEKPEALEALAAEYYDRFRPATPEARHLVDTLVSNEWLLRRFRRIEVQILKHEMEAAYRLDAKNPEGHAYVRAERSFDRLQRRINAAERNYHRALKELKPSPKLASFPHPTPLSFPHPTPLSFLHPHPIRTQRRDR